MNFTIDIDHYVLITDLNYKQTLQYNQKEFKCYIPLSIREINYSLELREKELLKRSINFMIEENTNLFSIQVDYPFLKCLF